MGFKTRKIAHYLWHVVNLSNGCSRRVGNQPRKQSLIGKTFGALGYERACQMVFELDSEPQCSKQSLRRKIFSCNRAKIGDGILNYFCNGKNGRFSKRMHVASGKLSHAVTGGMTFKSTGDQDSSQKAGCTPMKPVHGTAHQPISLPISYYASENKISRCFIDSRDMSVSPHVVFALRHICQFSFRRRRNPTVARGSLLLTYRVLYFQ